MQVDQTRKDNETISIDYLDICRALGVSPGRRYYSVAQQQMTDVGSQQATTLDEVGGVTHSAPPNAEALPPSKRYKTAMRTLTPLLTCSTMTARSESATSAVISSPRFMGPGCMTIACSGNRPMRSTSSPYRRVYSRALGKKAACIRSRCTRSIITASAP